MWHQKKYANNCNYVHVHVKCFGSFESRGALYISRVYYSSKFPAYDVGLESDSSFTGTMALWYNI